MMQTPQTLTRNSLTDSRRSSPLASIQVSSSRQRHTRQTRLYGGRAQDEDTPVQSPRYSRSLRWSGRYQAVMQSPVLDTPESGSHRRLTEESSYVVRRCLFPHPPSHFPPHSPSLTAPNQPRHHHSLPSPDGNSFTGIDAHLSVKKSASKRRLKRL